MNDRKVSGNSIDNQFTYLRDCTQLKIVPIRIPLKIKMSTNDFYIL